MKQSFFERGFTLLEVLVVTSIIAILSAVLYVSFGDARTNSSDRAMQAEFKQVQLALELYESQTGAYPATSTDLVPDYIAELPQASDSLNANCIITYDVGPSEEWYKYTAEECIAGGALLTEDQPLARCPSTCSDCAGVTMDAGYLSSDAFARSFAVYSAGGQCE